MTQHAPSTPPKIALVHLGLAALFAVAAAYMHLGAHYRLMQPQVLFPALGAVWFGMRALLALRPKL